MADRYFVRKGESRVASSPAQAVRLKYDGWREVPALPVPEAPAESVADAAEAVVVAEQELATAEAARPPTTPGAPA